MLGVASCPGRTVMEARGQRVFALEESILALTEILLFVQRGEMTHRAKPNLQRKRGFKKKIAAGRTVTMCDGREGWAPLWGQPGGRGHGSSRSEVP